MQPQIEKYWDAQPCNVRHGVALVGSKEWSDEVTARKYFVEPHILRFAQFNRWKGRSVLEIGCGIGTDTLEFVRAGARVWAVDISSSSIEIARKRSIRATLMNLDAEDWLPGCEYDLIYSFGVLHHTAHPHRVLCRAHALLKADGELRVMLYSRWCSKRMFRRQPEAQANCPLARSYTIKQAKQLVEACGYEVESVEKAHVFPWRVKDYIEHRYVKRLCYRWMPKSLFAWLERNFGEHLLIVARKA